MSNISLSLDEIYELAKTFSNNGCDDETSKIMADLVMKAERDGSLSHGCLEYLHISQVLKVVK